MYDISIDSNENDVNTISLIGVFFFLSQNQKNYILHMYISYTVDYYLKKKSNQFLNKIKYGFDWYV